MAVGLRRSCIELIKPYMGCPDWALTSAPPVYLPVHECVLRILFMISRAVHPRSKVMDDRSFRYVILDLHGASSLPGGTG
jgi:hypothetical protein